jgi:hypothetical protein
MRIIALVSLLFCSLSVAASQSNPVEARLLGISDSETVCLQWEVSAWTSQLVGFELRRKASSDEVWHPLSSGVIMPGYYVREWSDLGITDERLGAVIERYNDYTEFGENELRPERAVDRLQELGEVPAGTLISMNRDFNNALVAGFGFVDHGARLGDDYVYGGWSWS